jgi:hypothetical protein
MKRPIEPPRKRRIWRISREAPLGRYVDADEELPPPPEPQERFEPGWRQSSFDLAYGLDVCDAGDTLPSDVLDALFNKPAQHGRR